MNMTFTFAPEYAWQLWLARSREPPDAFRAFRMAHYAGMALWLGLAIDLAI